MIKNNKNCTFCTAVPGFEREKNQRCKEFLNCLGNGKSIYQLEAENDLIDEELNIRDEEGVYE